MSKEPIKTKEELIEWLEANTKFRNQPKDWETYLYSFRYYLYVATNDLNLANEFFDSLIYNYFEDSKPVTDAFEAINDKVRKYSARLNSMLGPKERKKKFKY